MSCPTRICRPAVWAAAVLGLSIVTATPAAQAATTTTNATSGTYDFFVFLKSQADLSEAATVQAHAERTRYVYETKKAAADRSQAGLRQLLGDRKAPFTSYWIANAIKVTGDKTLMLDLARRQEVDRIVADRSYPVVQPVRQAPAASAQEVEWNIDRVRAPEVWNTFSDRGEGIVVGTIDTGAQFDHPALVRQYRGAANDHAYSWYDPSSVCGSPSVAPCDNIGHGTHVLGTIVGDDGQDNRTGVAPKAKWVAAKGCESQYCSISALLAAGQWMLAPTDLNGQNPRPDLAPHVISNSWGGGRGDPFYQQVVSSWVAAGIFPVFASGNSGPGCGTAGSPGDYADSYSVGAFDQTNAVAAFSSRGPGGFGAENKPDVAAPGVQIRSSIPGGGYAAWDGTSMATPHVAATIALIWSVSESLRGRVTETRELLNSTAVPTEEASCGGSSGDNNVWGHGRLDAFAAVQQAPRGPVGTAAGVVRTGDKPLPDAQMTVHGPLSRKTTTNSAGEYQLPYLSVGQYEVTVRKFGYLTQSAQITITEKSVTRQDFDLVSAPVHTVTGQVRDSANRPVAKAAVTLPGTPLQPSISDENGWFKIEGVPEGTYDIVADRPGCLVPERKHIAVTDDATVGFTLQIKSDRTGHVCETAASSWVDTNTMLPLTGDENIAPVKLPFPVTLYGQSYQSTYVSTNGFLSFTTKNWSYPLNTSLPSPDEPNTAIYAFWDDLLIDNSASVRSAVTGTAPNRSFVVEWQNATFTAGPPDARVSVQVVLGESGAITVQYKGIGDSPVERGNSATIGIEDETGSDALEYTVNTPSLSDSTAIVLRVPGTGLVRGTVTDANDRRPVPGATVTVSQPGAADQVVTADADGVYQARAKVGDAHMRTTRPNYASDETKLRIPHEDAVIGHDVALRTGRVETQPATTEIVVPPGQTRQRTLTIANTGSAELSWQVKEAGGSPVQQAKPVARALDPNARTAKGLPGTAEVRPAAPGQVIRSWPTTGLLTGWGVGYQEGPWISDASSRRNVHFSDDGTSDRQWPTSWAGDWPADMAAVPSRNAVCQVNVGGTNGIHCWNPATGEVTDQIAGSFPWTRISQRGLAYRPDDDTFYIGGWNEGVVYHIKGLSHADRGAVISQCSASDPAISGLGWNSAFSMLWMATNSGTDTLYGLNPDTCQTVKTIAPPDNVPYTGAGLETDTVGNLWALSQGSPATAHLIDSGVPDFTEVPWLRVSPDSGAVKAGASQQITLSVDTTGLSPGVYGATVIVRSDSGRNPNVAVPVKLVVPGYQTAINTGGGDHRDIDGDAWIPDRAYTEGGYGYLDNGRSRIVRTTTPIARTTEQHLFQNLRENVFEYRFDNVPNGVYAIDLKFAELKRTKPNTRLVDVISEDTVLIPALDVANEAGVFTALNRTVHVTVADGQLNLRLISRKGDPIINAVRVTQRPDRIG